MFWFIIVLLILTITVLVCRFSKDEDFALAWVVISMIVSILYLLVGGVVTAVGYHNSLWIDNRISRIEARGIDKFTSDQIGNLVDTAESYCTYSENIFVPYFPFLGPECRLEEALRAIEDR